MNQDYLIKHEPTNKMKISVPAKIKKIFQLKYFSCMKQFIFYIKLSFVQLSINKAKGINPSGFY